MKKIITPFFFLVFVFSVNAQSEKYIDVVYTRFNVFSAQISTYGTIERASNGTILDNQQKDTLIARDTNYQPTGTLTIQFKNVSNKKIKSVSYLFELTDGTKIFYKNSYSNKLDLPANKFKKVRNDSIVISKYVANAVGVEKITIKKIVFDDKTSVKF